MHCVKKEGSLFKRQTGFCRCQLLLKQLKANFWGAHDLAPRIMKHSSPWQWHIGSCTYICTHLPSIHCISSNKGRPHLEARAEILLKEIEIQASIRGNTVRKENTEGIGKHLLQERFEEQCLAVQGFPRPIAQTVTSHYKHSRGAVQSCHTVPFNEDRKST